MQEAADIAKSPVDESKVTKTQKERVSKKPAPRDKESRKEPRTNDVYDFEKEFGDGSEILAYVPQRQAAKKAAEHIKSGLGTKLAISDQEVIDAKSKKELADEKKKKAEPVTPPKKEEKTVTTPKKDEKKTKKVSEIREPSLSSAASSNSSSSSASSSCERSSSGSSSSSSSDSEDTKSSPQKSKVRRVVNLFIYLFKNYSIMIAMFVTISASVAPQKGAVLVEHIFGKRFWTDAFVEIQDLVAARVTEESFLGPGFAEQTAESEPTSRQWAETQEAA